MNVDRKQNIKLNRGVKVMTPFNKIKDFSKGVILLDLKTTINESDVKSALPHCISVEIDERLGSLYNEKHHAFVVKFEESKHKPDNEIMSLPVDMFNSDMIIYGYVGDNIEIPLFDLLTQIYGNNMFLLGNISKETTTNQLQMLIPTCDCVISIKCDQICNETKTAFVIVTNSIPYFFLSCQYLPETIFVGKFWYCYIESSLQDSITRLKPYLDCNQQKEKTKHKKGNYRFLLTNFADEIDDKTIFKQLPRCGSVDYIESSSAFVVDFPSLFDEIELQEMRQNVKFDYILIKRNPATAIRSIFRFKNYGVGNKPDEDDE